MTSVSRRPLQFGANISPSAAIGADPVAAARRAEELGFDFVSTSDHPCGESPTNETWTILTWIAASTSRIRIATRVLGLPYRHPPMVAKMAETLDRLSGGRLILGLGGGYGDEEHQAFGLNVLSAKDKTDGLEEAVSIIRGLWTQERFSFPGRLFRTEAAPLEPKPTHAIPIWLGTFAPRALRVTGELADGWIPSLGYASGVELVQMRKRVLAAAEAAGRDPSTIAIGCNTGVLVDEHAPTSADMIAGSPQAVIDRLGHFIEHGFDTFSVMLGDDPSEQAERFANEVIPALRRA